MNILFTTAAAPKICPMFTEEKRPPLGLGSLMSIVRNDGHKVFFIDNFLKPTDFVKDGFLQKNKIDFVAASANTICYKDTLKTFNEIEDLRKKGQWKGKIVVGGPQTTLAPDTIPDFVDHVVQGEGEKVILKIINGEISDRVIKQDRLKDLDWIPFQPWDIFTKLPYDYSCYLIDKKPVFTMNTSRGCLFDCTFCSVQSVWGKKYACFSADRIVDEIDFVVKNYGAKGINFREDNFTLKRKRVEEFCTKVRNVKWFCESRVATLCDEELVKMMSASGCEGVYLGVESGSQRILDKMEKKITVEQIEQCIMLCKKYKIKTYCSLVTGVPDETYEDYLQTKNLMKKLKPYAHNFSVFLGMPYSTIYKEAVEKKSFEHIDDLRLIYLPGYDVRTKYFYGLDSKKFVDYEFKQRTEFDQILLKEMEKNKRNSLVKRTVSVLPDSLIEKARKQNKLRKLYKRIVYR